MSDLDQAIDAVEASPDGPHIGAYFDLDGTLVKGFTALAFLQEDIGELGPTALYELARDVKAAQGLDDGDFQAIARATELLAGRPVTELQELSKRVFKKRVAASMRPGARELVRAHRKRGHTVVMATAAARVQAQTVADDLDIPHLVCTELESTDGTLTGRLLGRPAWGPEKARKVAAHAGAVGVDLARSFAYANGLEDRPLLDLVGHPAAVCPGPDLVAHANATGMPTYMLDDPAPATVRSMVGTLASMYTFNTGLAAALAGRLISGGRWKAIGPTLATAAELALKVAGIEVRAQGREHLEAARPAVFVVNHQSNLDPVVAGMLIRHDFTGVGKQDIASDPRAFAMGWLDIALIDRSDSESARASVSALVHRIRAGESVAIWPEGTRMPTPKLGPFKKGAFHLAIDAGVPLVPIVLRNTGELWPRGALLLRPGVVDVCVLPPIPTADWSKDQLDDRIAEVRAQFEHTLENWPTGP